MRVRYTPAFSPEFAVSNPASPAAKILMRAHRALKMLAEVAQSEKANQKSQAKNKLRATSALTKCASIRFAGELSR